MVVSSPSQQSSPTAIKQPAAKRGRAAKLLAMIACQLLAILFVEGVLYCAGLGEEEIFQFDKEIGFVHMRNKRITWRSEGFAQSYLDAAGLRQGNVPIAKPANTYRVALLGDSMVEGFQVPFEKSFGEVIAKRLSPLDGKQVQVLNFGTSGYSTVQEYLLLKRDVLKYQPDLVIDCYDGRDIFENWSPPDQVITNVRPYALRLPHGSLVIDSMPVRRWMRSPRGQFMVATTWLRHHSRIIGMLSALDLEFSQHNAWYRIAVDIISHPRDIKNRLETELRDAIASMKNGGPSFNINFFDAAPKAATKPAANVFHSASENSSLSQNPIAAAEEKSASASAPSRTRPHIVLSNTEDKWSYTDVIGHTLQSLFQQMRKSCNENGAQFAVISLPVRTQLCPLPGAETNFAGIDYNGELDIVSSVCYKDGIPYFDVEKLAETLPYDKREALYYSVHLTPQGHQFVADAMQPFTRRLLMAKPSTSAGN